MNIRVGPWLLNSETGIAAHPSGYVMRVIQDPPPDSDSWEFRVLEGEQLVPDEQRQPFFDVAGVVLIRAMVVTTAGAHAPRAGVLQMLRPFGFRELTLNESFLADAKAVADFRFVLAQAAPARMEGEPPTYALSCVMEAPDNVVASALVAQYRRMSAERRREQPLFYLPLFDPIARECLVANLTAPAVVPALTV